MAHEDQKYIDGLNGGDEPSIEEIYKKFLPKCIAYILKNGGSKDVAFDIFQDALVKIILRNQSKPIKLEVPFGAYIYVVYRNLWISHLRKSKPYSEILHLIVDEESLGFFKLKSLNSKELKFIVLRNCFDRLGEFCKELIGMRLLGMNSKEIAKELNLESNNVDNKMFECRKKLKKCSESDPLFNQI